MNTIEHRWKERHIQEREAVRALTLQMAPIQDVIAQLLPSPQLVTEGAYPWGDIQTTAVILEAKNSRSLHPNDITPPGGKFVQFNDPTAGTWDEQLADRAAEIVWSELALNAMRVAILPKLRRTVDIRNPSLFGKGKPGIYHTDEQWVKVIASPHDQQVKVFPPRYQIKEAIRFTPKAFGTFLENESYPLKDGTTGRLLDTLSRNDERRQEHHVKTAYTGGQSEETFRHALKTEALKYEATVLYSVVSKFMVLTTANYPREVVEMFCSLEGREPTDYESAKRIISTCQSILLLAELSYNEADCRRIKSYPHISKELRDAYLKVGLSTTDIKRRELFIQEFIRAYNQVTLAETMELTKKTGPQQPYILAAIIPTLDRLTDVEYALLSQNPWIKHLIDVPLRVFRINPNKPNWHKKLIERLKEIQSWKNDNNSQKRENYKRIMAEIDREFCHPVDQENVPTIADTTLLGLRSEGANAYTRHLKEEIAPVSTPKVRYAISTNPFGSATHVTLELIYRMWGLNQYNANKKPLPRSEQTAAWIKLLHELLDQQIEDIWTIATDVSIEPLRGAFDTMFDESVDGHIVKDESYSMYLMNKDVFKRLKHLSVAEPIRLHDGTIVDLSTFSISVVANIRVKDKIELKRKWLERGGFRPDGSVDLTDFFGFFEALNDSLFRQELISHYPQLGHKSQERTVEALVAQWKRYAATIILRGMEFLVKEESPTKLNMWRDRGRVTSPLLEGILPMDMQKEGSAAARNAFEWLKYVLHVKDDQGVKEVEIQFFPSLDELQRKIVDNARFHIIRLFEKPPHRYPPVYLEFAAQEGFEEMLELQFQARDWERRRPKWMNWLASMLLHAHDALVSQQSIIYENTSEPTNQSHSK